MKWIFRFVSIAIIAVAIGLPFFIDNKQGQPMLSMPSLDDLTPELPTKESVSGGERTFYKWQDENGQWHFGDEPPPEVKNVVPVTVDINANIIQPIKLDPPEDSSVNMPDKVYPPHAGGYKPPTSADDTLSLDRALNIVNDAKAVREAMESRNKALESYSSESKGR